MLGDAMQPAIALLSTTSPNPKWDALKKSSHVSTRRLLGSWTGGAEILGDYLEEEATRHARTEYEDISLACTMMLVDFGQTSLSEGFYDLSGNGNI
ncbi:hypothetical protein RRSWK_01645 [Rhodopirellula sp. SWK7]|nr:hypothetical protein RRSWK_01645 [Rhodopirellula sp. SWK7]